MIPRPWSPRCGAYHPFVTSFVRNAGLGMLTRRRACRAAGDRFSRRSCGGTSPCLVQFAAFPGPGEAGKMVVA